MVSGKKWCQALFYNKALFYAFALTKSKINTILNTITNAKKRKILRTWDLSHH